MTELTAHQRAKKKQYEKLKLTHTNIRITKELRDWLKEESQALGLTMEEYIKYIRARCLSKKVK